MKRYVEEPDSAGFARHLLGHRRWITARHTWVEVRRNLSRLLDGPALGEAGAAFAEDWARCFVVELDETTCARAADIAVATGARTLDALHLAAACRVGAGAVTLLTSDVRLAQAARALGLAVLGA